MQLKEIDALKKACLYSIPPNKLGYCGPADSWLSFQSFLSNQGEENAIKAREQLGHFYALHPYLELIAKANNLQPFDPEVIEAYWLGNDLLENVQYAEMQKTIISFQSHGLPRPIAERKAVELPRGLLPHHSMHVLYVNFISPKVRSIVSNLSNCLVQWASIKEETKRGLRVKGIELFSEGNELKLREKEKTVQNPFGLELKQGDQVSVHWENVVEKISSDELKNLKKYTIKNLETVNYCISYENNG